MSEGRDLAGQENEAVVTLAVPDMDCPSCAGKVGRSLDTVDGVITYELNPTNGTATVTFDADHLTEADIIVAIQGAGYRVAHSADDGTDPITPPSDVWTSPRAIKTWIGAVFLVVGLGLHFIFTSWNVSIATTPIYDITLADTAFVIAILTSGIPVVRSGYYSARNRHLDIHLLMGTAIIAATAIGLFIEAATLAVLFSIAELLERYAMDQTRDSLRELMELAPNEARILRNGEEVTVPVEEVEIGERIAVRPGEKIPVDGVVRHGNSAVDQSPITGESIPVDKAEDDEVYAGTLNEAGYLEIEATTAAPDSTLSQIIALVRDAQAEKTDKEQFVDRFASYYTPAVVVLALLTAAIPPLVIDGSLAIELAGLSHTFVGDWQTWFVRGLTLLVIACPCAFVISTPVSVASGITSAARNGVLIKGGNYLEAMGEVDAIAFDKTGTLTKGELTVTDVIPLGDMSESEVLRYASALEHRSEHPIADAILARADERDLRVPDVSAFESIPGKGVRARIGDTLYYAGNLGLFKDRGVRSDGGVLRSAKHEEVIARLEREGKTIVVVGTDDELFGVIGIADEIRPEAKRAVEHLHQLGVAPLVMLTGDNEGTARAVADKLGLDAYRAALLPAEKVNAVEELSREYGDVAMVGDGVNDAPSLARASVGVAMGAAGTDTALETADIALMGDDIGALPYLYSLSHTANGVIRQNIWSSLGVKLLLAVGVPFGYVSVAIAVLVGDMGMSLGVTGNAMRLSRITPERVRE